LRESSGAWKDLINHGVEHSTFSPQSSGWKAVTRGWPALPHITHPGTPASAANGRLTRPRPAT